MTSNDQTAGATDRSIVLLGPADRAPAIATLAAAFFDDPAMVWMMPDAARRAQRLNRLMGWMFDEALRHGFVLGDPAAQVVTLWRNPGHVHHSDPIWHPGALRFVHIFGRRVGRAIKVDEGIRGHLPGGEDWLYLKMAAVRPDMQGKGLGGLAIRTGLQRAAELGVAGLLETATPSNVGLYQRLGFATISEWNVKGGGPHFWTMVHNRSGYSDDRPSQTSLLPSSTISP